MLFSRTSPRTSFKAYFPDDDGGGSVARVANFQKKLCVLLCPPGFKTNADENDHERHVPFTLARYTVCQGSARFSYCGFQLMQTFTPFRRLFPMFFPLWVRCMRPSRY